MAAQATHQVHPIDPVYDERSEVLVLGSFPSPKSREIGFFYGNPQNRMWRVLAHVFDEPLPTTNERKRDLLLRHHIAMWDVLASCTIKGANDATITDEAPNDLHPLFDDTQVKAVFCAGNVAKKLYVKHCEEELGVPATYMPSPSPTNAAAGLPSLVYAWSDLRDHLSSEDTPILDVPDVVQLEHDIADSGTSLAELMDRAGTWLAHRVHRHDPVAPIVILAGKGNNGGDGWVAARELAELGHQVVLVTPLPPEEITAQPAHDAAAAIAPQLEAEGVLVLVQPDEQALAAALLEAPVIVDAMLGTGFAHDNVRAPFNNWIASTNAAHERGAHVISADCPSGLNAQTGAAADQCINADETVTMIVSKTGLHTGEGPARCGTLHVAHLCDLKGFLD